MHQHAGADEWVFAYGSLVAAPVPGARAAVLAGFRRHWGVAMDNRVAIPGYKRYLDPDSSDAPAVDVAFLDLAPDSAGAVNGVCRPVDAEGLAALDARERQYVRIEVSGLIAGIPGRIWTYAGSPGARARQDAARTAGTLVVVRSYRDAVLAGFDALGPGQRTAFEASTEPCAAPVADLVRIDLPAGQPEADPPAGS